MPHLLNLETRQIRRNYVERNILRRLKAIAPPLGSTPGPILPGSQLPERKLPEDTRPISKIAIVGGGVAGLRAAMMLGLDFEVDLYEAGKEVGGRLFTHKFENSERWDYFDVGAMRFPNTELMRPTFELFEELGLRPNLLKYNISDDNNIRAFNLERFTVGQLKVKTYADDPFRVGRDHGGTVPMQYANQDPGALLYGALEDLIQGLVNDIKHNTNTGMDALMEVDHHSTRSFLREVHNFEPSLIDYIETMSFGTGWFDRALAETVFEELCFQYDQAAPSDLEWFCVADGSYQIIEAMKKKLEGPKYKKNVTIKTKHRVTTAVYAKDAPASEPKLLTISGLNWGETDSPEFSEKYSHVIFALPPPCLRTIDLSTCRLDYEQRNGMRQVSVGPSCKIGIKFKSAWWTRPEINIKGGQSTTDRMARTIVYPSYGDGESTVLIASYSWTQDATALGAWIQGRNTPAEERLKELMLQDIAYVHSGQILLEELKDQYEDMFPWDWSHHPDSMGAFGIFGPDQYSQYMQALSRPAAGGHMHFVGETISTIHGWVAGALQSAARGVQQMLALHTMANAKANIGRSQPMMLLGLNSIAASSRGTSNNQVDLGPDNDLLESFIRKWSPDFGISPSIFTQQLEVSRTLQLNEFGLSPTFSNL